MSGTDPYGVDVADAVAVIGCGAMGQGIAQVAAQAGHTVLMHDARAGAAEAGRAAILKALDRLVEKGKLSAATREAVAARLIAAETLSHLAPARLVVEAVVEDLEVKRGLFAAVEDVVADDAILATNTSSLSIAAIAAGLRRPERFAGMHFFNPVPLMRLVEVISGLATARPVAETLHALSKAWGKSPVYARSTPGFIVNRVARPFYAEGLRLLGEGAGDAATIDAAMRECGGFRMGPFELMDLIGHDVNFAVTASVWRAYFNDQRFTPSLIQQELVEAGRLGRKTGRGFYDYAPDAAKPQPATLAAGPGPTRVTMVGDLGPASPLAGLLERAGIEVERRAGGGTGWLEVSGVRLALTDGRSATRRGADEGVRDLALFDLALDYAEAKRVVIAVADQASPGTRDIAAGLFQTLGKAVTALDDAPGLVVARTLAMLVNEAADATAQGVASPDDIDVAMTQGVNYPRGPLAWGAAIGMDRVVDILSALGAAYGEDRYRVSPWLRRKLAAAA